MSVNLELPTAEGLRYLAPGKTRKKILKPMRQIQQGISFQQNLLEGEKKERKTKKAGFSGGAALLRASEGSCKSRKLSNRKRFTNPSAASEMGRKTVCASRTKYADDCWGTMENDYQMMKVTEALYQGYGLKRVFFSAFVKVNEDSSLPEIPGGPPLLREHRLYQADWLLRFYGFRADELLTEKAPNFNIFLDPKCDWALRHLEYFPVEVNTARYEMLLRVPGIGVKSARRILAARKNGALDFSGLKKLGVVLKRAVYFITCSGKMEQGCRLEQDFITSSLIGDERRKAWDIAHSGSYYQMSLFQDMNLQAAPTREDVFSTISGTL